MQPAHHHLQHHHQGIHHHPHVHTGAKPEAELAALGLGFALAFGPVGIAIAAGAGSIAGATWLARRVRARASQRAVLDTSDPLPLILSGLAVQPSKPGEGLFFLRPDD